MSRATARRVKTAGSSDGRTVEAHRGTSSSRTGRSARQNSASWDSVAPGKATELRRELPSPDRSAQAPRRWSFAFVSIARCDRRRAHRDRTEDPRRGDEPHLRGVSSRQQLPAGATQAASGRGAARCRRRTTSPTSSRRRTPHARRGHRLRRAQPGRHRSCCALHRRRRCSPGCRATSINVIMVRTMWRLRENVEAKINRLPLVVLRQGAAR